MNRGMLWVALAMLVLLVWLGPAGCLREDPELANAAEREAKSAEVQALARPDIERYDAQAILEAVSALRMTHFERRPTFWRDYVPAWPAGLRLKELSATDPETAAPGVQTRKLSMTLVPDGTVSAEGEAPRAPGGWQASMHWIQSLNKRPDMRLNDVRLDTAGGINANFDVWLLDPLPEPEPEPEPEPVEETPAQ